jgi:hypothetical protein
MQAKLLPTNVVREYSNAVSKHGPESPQARQVYAKYAGLEGFAKFARALADIKLSVGGCGISYEPPPEPGDVPQDTTDRSTKEAASNSSVPAGAR